MYDLQPYLSIEGTLYISAAFGLCKLCRETVKPACKTIPFRDSGYCWQGRHDERNSH